MSRLRVTFGRGEPVKYLAHLDLVRLWERALRRAEVPLAYSAGFTPRPKLTVAAPLPVGVTSEAELMDLLLAVDLTPAEFAGRVRPQLPAGITLLDVRDLPSGGLALPSQVRAIEYAVTLATPDAPDEVRGRIACLLGRQSLPFTRDRGGKVRQVDLRPFILDLRYEGLDPVGHVMAMCLRSGNDGAARPDDIAAALGYTARPRRIHRTRIICEEMSDHDGP